MSKILIPDGTAESEIIIKKSRFLGQASYLESPGEVKENIKQLSRKHPQARHIVYAYITGDSRSVFGMSDAGEPHGTAGRPIMDVLKGSGLTNVLLTVVRYFGGIKLGTGGLVSAYSNSAKETLAKLPVKEKIDQSRIQIQTDYQAYEKIKRILPDFSAEIINENFSAAVELMLFIPRDQLENFKKMIGDIGRGGISVKEG